MNSQGLTDKNRTLVPAIGMIEAQLKPKGQGNWKYGMQIIAFLTKGQTFVTI